MEAAAFVAISDRRYKNNLQCIPPSTCLDTVSKMVSYTYELSQHPGKQRAGLIAQEVLKLAPHLVQVSGAGTTEEHYTVNYQDLIAYITSAISALWWRLKCVAVATLVALTLLSWRLARLPPAQ